MTTDLMKLRELAEAATPGPWIVSDPTETMHAVRTASGRIVADVGYSGTIERDQINADYIAAANPAKVIELLDALEALGREVAEWRKADAPNGWINHLREECNSMASKLYASPAAKDAGLVADTRYQEIREALESLMAWEVKNVKVWNHPTWDNAQTVIDRHNALSKIGGV